MMLEETSEGAPEALLREDLARVAPGDWDAAHPPVAAFAPDSVAAAFVDAGGKIIGATTPFRALPQPFRPDAERLARARRGGPPAAVVEELSEAESVVALYAAARDVGDWPIPSELRAAAAASPGAAVVLVADVRGATGPLTAACQAYGLTGLQTRVVLETIRGGGVRPAAAALGISFHTAREALAGAMARTRTRRLPALVLRLTTLAFGALPESASAEVLTDIWGITPRQATIAGLIASGSARREAARVLGISEALLKKELDQAYQVLQVDSAASLARKVGEAAALHWLTRATRGEIGALDLGGEPLRFVGRTRGGRIAVSDYGPPKGAPVLVAHSGLTTRAVARRLVRALQAAGYRPIAIDRPGFGMTDPAEAPASAGPHDAAVEDALRVMDTLGIGRFDLVARGAARFVVALQDQAPERLGRVVLVNPGLHATVDGLRAGLFGALKAAYARNPALIGQWVTRLSRRITYERHGELVRRWLRGSAPDLAAMDDPEIAHDYFISQRMFATGRIAGYVAEQMEYVNASALGARRGTTDWRVLVGAHDAMYAPDAVLAYWRAVLPDATFRTIPDGGRLLAISHPEHVAEALRETA